MDILDVVCVGGDTVRIGSVRVDCANVGIGLPGGDECIHGLDVVNHRDDTACEEKQERDDAQRADHIEADEDIWYISSELSYSRTSSKYTHILSW